MTDTPDTSPSTDLPAGSNDEPAAIPADLLDILRCPLGLAPVRLEGQSLVCTKCGLRYAIDGGIPRMLVEDAELPQGVSRIEDLACYTRQEG